MSTRFTSTDMNRANADWFCTCGPAALAAICGLTLDEVRPFFQPAFPGWTTPTRMLEALRRSGRKWYQRAVRDVATGNPPWPQHGLARIQWHGTWTANGNQRWSYVHTHWVGCHTRGDVRSIWDVNAMSEGGADGWLLLGDWVRSIVPELTREIPRASGGWHVTHVIEVER